VPFFSDFRNYNVPLEKYRCNRAILLLICLREQKSGGRSFARTKIRRSFVYANKNPAVVCLREQKSGGRSFTRTKIRRSFVCENKNPAVVCLREQKSGGRSFARTKIRRSFVCANKNPADIIAPPDSMFFSKDACERLLLLGFCL